MGVMPMPRVQGKVGQVEEPGHEANGRWVWIVYVTIMAPGETAEPIVIESFYLKDKTRNHFATEDEAKRDLEKACADICSKITQAVGGDGTEGFYDLKANKHRFGFPEDSPNDPAAQP